jgi:chemotaxis signal transduction protein/CheY-like chemotaxis protein
MEDSKMTLEPNLKILLVEDSTTMRKMELSILRGMGFENVVEAEDGEKAIDLLNQQDDIDLIISDWNMPNKDGYELLVWVRQSPIHAKVPFMMATAQGERSKISKAEAAGVSGVVSKPFTPDDLKAKMEQALAGESQDMATTQPTTRSLRVTPEGKLRIKAAHIQITDHLTLGVLKSLIASDHLKAQHFELETACMQSWNQVQAALEQGEVDLALVLAPIAMDLYGYGVPIKLVLLAHKNGSIFVRKHSVDYKEPGTDFFRDSVFYIPHRLSVHNMLSHRYLSQLGLKPGVPGESEIDVRFEVAPPIKMPEFLKDNPQASGFMVAEPLGTKAIAAGIADLQFLSKEVWPEHPCCVVAARQEVIDQHPQALQDFCNLMVESGRYIKNRPDLAADIGVSFLDPQGKLGLKKAVLKNVLTEPNGISTDDLFPVLDDLRYMQEYMCDDMAVGTRIDMDAFVDSRFAQVACGGQMGASQAETGASADELRHGERANKAMLEKEGKYLSFVLSGQEYGIPILNIKEIIGIQPVTHVPHTAEHIKGVINLRGRVITVIDLRLRFGLMAEDYNERTCIVVLETEGENGMVQTGVVVDAVSEVLNLEASALEPAPAFGMGIDTDYIQAMAKVDDDVKILLDIQRVLQEEAEFGGESSF